MEEKATKRIRKELQYLNDLAYERYLDIELAKLQAQFSRWEAKKISAFELSGEIHEFHKGPAKDLYVQFQGSSLNPIRVARAIVEEVLSQSEVSAETLGVISRQIQGFKS